MQIRHFEMARMIDTIAAKDDIAAFRNDISNELNSFRSEISCELRSLRFDIKLNNKHLFQWMLFFAVTQTIAQILILLLLV